MPVSQFTCEDCGKSFTRQSNLHRHRRTTHNLDTFSCTTCGICFNRRDNYLRHTRNHIRIPDQGSLPIVGSEILTDTHIQESVEKENVCSNVQNQVGSGVPPNDPQDSQVDDTSKDREECITSEEAIHWSLIKISISADDQTKYDPLTFLKSKEEEVRSVLQNERNKRKRIKFYLILQVRFTKTRGDQVEVAEPHFHGRCFIVLKREHIEHALRESIKKDDESFIEYQREVSNWALDKVLAVSIHIVQYNPMKGFSYLPLPATLAKKKAIINVMNTDTKRFMWSVLAALYPVTKNPQRDTKYADHTDKLDFTDIPFPVKVADILKFEKRNNISINVFGYERSEVYPLHLTRERGLKHVDLLVLDKGDNSHYCCIKNFNRLMGDQNGDNNQYHYCHYCLHGFTKKNLLEKHIPYREIHDAQRTEMPSEEEKWLKFSDISKQLRVPFVVYADFESILERQYGCQPDPSKSSTIKLAKHVPSGFTYKVVLLSPETTKNHVTYRGHDAVDVFVDHMVKHEDEITRVLRNPKPMDLSEEETKAFQEATLCHICHGELRSDVVRDHCT